MNRNTRLLAIASLVSPLILLATFQARATAPGPLVSEVGNVHNLSSVGYQPGTKTLINNTNPYRAAGDISATTNLAGKQICIFCHTPHNANVEDAAPLWNRAFSSQSFSRYSSGTLQIRVKPTTSALAQYDSSSQPDGASKLCLSCHDGVSYLGDVRWGGPITMVGSNVITGLGSFSPSTNKMKFGHHPVSFVYNGTIQQQISSGRFSAGASGGFVLPSASSPVKLDKRSKMQCTTCHDPHQNISHDDRCYSGASEVTCDAINTRKISPFWVLHNGSNTASQDHDDVCTSCHKMISGSSPFP